MKRLLAVSVIMIIILQGCVMSYSTKKDLNGMTYETMHKFEYHTDDALIEMNREMR